MQAFLDRYQLEKDVEAFELISKIETKVRKNEEGLNEENVIDQIEEKLYEIRRKNSAAAILKQENVENPQTHDENDLKSSEKNNSENSQKSSENGQKSAKNYGVVRCDENSVFVSTVPLKVRRADLAAVFAKIGGFQKLCVSEPIPKYAMNRFAWVTFDSQESCFKALELNGFKVFSELNRMIFVFHSFYWGFYVFYWVFLVFF